MTVPLFPGSVKTYTDKVDGVSVVQAADINSVQAEVNAVETALGTNPATSALPSAGSYNPNGVSTSVGARIANLEAGLTGDATDGTRVGYTVLASGNYTSAPGAISVNGAAYSKLVVVIRVTTIGSGAGITLTVNNCTTVKYGFFAYPTTGVPTAGGGSQSGGAFPISNVQTPANGDTITAEVFNTNGTGAKTCSWINGHGFGSGIATAGGTVTSPITTLTISSSAYPTTATYIVYGVK